MREATSVVRAPLLVPAVMLLAAILAQEHGAGPACVGIGVALVWLRRDAGIGCLLGYTIAALHGHPAIVDHELRGSRYTGTVVGDVRRAEYGVQFAFAVDGIGTLRATAHANVAVGERLTVRARIEPIDEARNPGEPSPRTIALDDGIVGSLVVRGIVARRPPDPRDVRIWPGVARAALARVARDAIPEPEATVLAGALWGERAALPDAARDDFQATGTVHVLVTAGLHLGVIAAIVGACFALLRVPRVASALATIPVVYAYAWLSGWHVPSQRAATMIAVALVARACGARAVSLNTLALAAIAVACAWPVAVGSVSFALSFSCVAAIVLFAEPLAVWFARRHVPVVVGEALALTISTQIGVWPLTAATFFTVAPYAIVANAAIVPLVGIAMTLGVAVIALFALIASHPVAPAVALAAILARWESWLLALILAVAHAIADIPGARQTIAPPPLWSIAAYDLVAIVAARLIRARPRVAIGLLAAGSFGVIGASGAPHDGHLVISMLDVGQGDAIVIRTPRGRTIVIDTGGRLERGPVIDGRSPAERSADRIVIPALRRAGIRNVDLLVLTHPHGDHVGAASAILEMMPVGWVADSGQRYGGHAYNDAREAARARGVPVVVPACHQRWVDDEVQLTFLTPCGPPFSDGANDVNENSLVIRVQYGTLRALFMGDAGFQSEERLLAQGDDLHADILKVGHHGSAYSSSAAFIAAVHPSIAIVSVGRHNVFGHPAATTLETLRHAGASIFRTDECGAILISTTINGPPSVTTMQHCTQEISQQRRAVRRQ